MVALRKPAPERITLTEFLNWTPDDPTGAAYQLVDGETVPMAPASRNHAALMAGISALLRNYLMETGSSCSVLVEPGIVPHIGADWNFRLPEVGVVCSPPSSDQVVRDPVLLIEILSPSNESETRTNIWAYTTIPSVQEILTVRSTRMEAELFRRRPDGNWPESPEIVVGSDRLTLVSIGLAHPCRPFTGRPTSHPDLLAHAIRHLTPTDCPC
jgi:Uma2 family endonuclease